METKKLFLLDAYALIFRAYYALIRAPRFTAGGMNTSAIFGFVNTLNDILKKENPSHIAVCFDPQGPTFRHEAYEAYKAEREATPEDIKLSIPYIKEILQAYRIPIIEVPGFEADDVIASLAVKAEKQGFDTFMMTPDKDFGQLVTDHIKIYRPAYKGGEFEIRGVDEVCERYKLKSPRQVIDLLALMGDKVDNIPGCPGVGEVTAEKLIAQFGSVENLLANTDQIKGALRAKVESNAEQIKFSKFLATIVTDAPVEFNEQELRRSEINVDALRDVFERLEFRTLLKRIIEPDAKPAAPAPKPANTTPSLFDFADPQPAQEAKETPQLPAPEISGEVTVAESPDKAAEAIAKAMKCPEVAIAFINTTDEAMTASLHGFAIACNGSSTYIPTPDASWLETARKLFESDTTTKISANIKMNITVLRRLGVGFSAPYYDTEVAHYLIQPEQPHYFGRLAETYLGITAIPFESVFAKKGKSTLLRTDIDTATIAAFASQQAQILLALKPRLDADIESLGMSSLLSDIELPLIEVLADMEHTGVRIDTAALNEYSQRLTSQMNEIEQQCFELAGEKFNTASPMQVGEILFEKLKIDSKAKRTRSGQYSTTEEILVKLADRHPLVDKILQLRGVRKLLTTYVNTLPELINPTTGRIHTTFNQTVTATGRLSSTNPNLQNIPVRNDEGREIRKAFIPAEGCLFFSADYSQIELRLVADLSGDEAMTASFLSGNDVHRATAATIYHVPLDQVTDTQRRNAKTANFGILYGISAFGLAERLRIPRAEAKMLIDGYMAAYPGVQQYIANNVERAKQLGYVTTLFGRRRMLPDINSRNAVVRSFSERNAINAPIQGVAADIIKIAMVNIFREFKRLGLKSKMILQVHDELNFDVVPDELDTVRNIVKTKMMGAYSGRIPLEVSSGVGANWLEAH